MVGPALPNRTPVSLYKGKKRTDEMSKAFEDGIYIPKIIKELELKNYHEDMGGSFMVWVNLSRMVHQEFTVIQSKLVVWEKEGNRILDELIGQIKEAEEENKSEKELEKIRKANGKKFEDHVDTIDTAIVDLDIWYSKIWSQTKKELHHYSVSEVQAIRETSKENDGSSFWNWLTKQTQLMIILHSNQHLKK